MSGFTQEVQFGREVKSVAIRHEGVVPLVFWFDVINSQFVDPAWATSSLFNMGSHDVLTVPDKVLTDLPMCVILTRLSALTSTPFLYHVPLTFSSDTSHLNTA